MFPGIKSTSFESTEFKEDSVRELIIAPMIAKLGYLPTGSTRVIRSKTLRNPFIRVGTRNHPVTTIPDYTFIVDDKPLLVLDAKAPNQGVLDTAHIQQAYSYAIHPEVRCDEFGLCNGKELAIFSVAKERPLLHLNFDKFESEWSKIERFIAPRYLSEPVTREFAPDFGYALKRMGIKNDTELVMLKTRLNLFGRVSDDLITATANTDFPTAPHCASFDFHPNMLPKILSGLPDSLAKQFVEALSRSPFQAAAGLVIELDLTVILGDETQGKNEMFIPLIIKEIHASRFNPEEVPNDPNDIPPHVFNLRDAFTINDES